METGFSFALYMVGMTGSYKIGKCFCNSLIINRTFWLIVYNITDFSPGACDVEIIVNQTFE